jgi:serpin B
MVSIFYPTPYLLLIMSTLPMFACTIEETLEMNLEEHNTLTLPPQKESVTLAINPEKELDRSHNFIPPVVVDDTILNIKLIQSISSFDSQIKYTKSNHEDYTVVESHASYDDRYTLTDDEIDTYAYGNQALSFSLHRLLDHQENMMISAYSISQNLSLLYPAAQGESADVISYFLQIDTDVTHALRINNAIDNMLINRDEFFFEDQDQDQAQDSISYLHHAHALWVQAGYSWSESYLFTLKRYLNTAVYEVDFTQNPNMARDSINDWTSEKTNNIINDVIPNDSIDQFTKMVLSNTLALKTGWKSPFLVKDTSLLPFALPSGDYIDVPTMNQINEYHITQDEHYVSVILPLQGKLDMVIVLPNEGRMNFIKNRLNPNFWTDINSKSEPHLIDLHLPKFNFTTEVTLNNHLIDSDLHQLFTSKLNLSGMSNHEDSLAIDLIQHRTLMNLNEEGVEALAINREMPYEQDSASDQSIIALNMKELSINRPFLFSIQDRKSKVILYLGQVISPIND